MIFIGIDLAWADGSAKKAANESGAVILDSTGKIVHAGWTVGVKETVDWLESYAPKEALLFVDAPLVVTNKCGQRLCEKQVGQRYWRWKVSANSTNTSKPERLAGVDLRKQLEQRGWSYSDGCKGPPPKGRYLSECYPYTTIVGAEELGYDDERPRYKRKGNMPQAEFRPYRAEQCDELIRRVAKLSSATPPMDISSHPEMLILVEQPSPISDKEYKHREDLLDAALCAWTASLWVRWGEERCQVLGRDDPLYDSLRATIIAPARKEQRREGS